MSVPTKTSFSIFNHRQLMLFIVARAAATIAYQMTGVAIGWQIYELTNRALDLGLVGLIQFLPSLLLVLYVGHASDRYDRRRIVALAQLAEGIVLCSLVLVPMMYGLSREGIFLSVFALGIARAFEYSTTQAIVPSLVEPEFLPQAVSAGSVVKQAATIAGPVLGGALYLLGPETVYATAAVLFFAAAMLIILIRSRRVVPSREPASIRTLFAGISFIRGNPVVLGAISLDLFAVLFGGATALLPVYARDILHTGPQGFGILRAAPAMGAVAASVYLTRNPLRRRVGRVMFASVATFGLMTIVFGLSNSILLSCAALVVLGWADMISVVIRASLVQLETPDEMRGRVSAVNAVFIGTSNELGEFESGVTAAWLGAVPAVLLGGVGTLVVVALWMRFFPELLKRERLQGG